MDCTKYTCKRVTVAKMESVGVGKRREIGAEGLEEDTGGHKYCK